MSEVFCLEQSTTAPVYSTVGVGDYAIVVANRWGSGLCPSRESTCFYQISLVHANEVFCLLEYDYFIYYSKNFVFTH